ncbi:MAG: hypothetical protein IJ233_00770 [Pyramidobacter sp.]|nr:hypothetical protein [Pyramidobacter sp.]
MSTNNGTNKYKQAFGEALDALSKLVDVLSEGTASKDSQAETSGPEAEQVEEKEVFVAQSLGIGTMEANDKRWIVISMESENTPVKLIHPMTETCARSAAQSLLSLADKLKEE